MKGLMNFLAMGGYAAYVWPAYGLALVVLMGNFVAAVRQHQKMLTRLKNQRAGEG